MRRGDALIRHYLNTEPPADIELWSSLVNEALWIEQRKLKQQAELMAALFGEKN